MTRIIFDFNQLIISPLLMVLLIHSFIHSRELLSFLAIDTTTYEYRCSTSILEESINHRPLLDDSTMVLYETRKGDSSPFDDDESPQQLRSFPIFSETFSDTDRISLSSIEMNSNSNDRD